MYTAEFLLVPVICADQRKRNGQRDKGAPLCQGPCRQTNKQTNIMLQNTYLQRPMQTHNKMSQSATILLHSGQKYNQNCLFLRWYFFLIFAISLWKLWTKKNMIYRILKELSRVCKNREKVRERNPLIVVFDLSAAGTQAESDQSL